MPITSPFATVETSVIMTVSQLNARIKGLLEANFPYVWVRGEISNLKIPASGHAYFTLKDKNSQIRTVMFRTQYTRLKFRPEDGMAVLCQGRLSVYEPRGEYQIIADILEPEGLGALQLAFEQLKEKLLKEGLFDSERKRPLPMRPQRIAVITSSTGAAVRDILKVFQRCPYPLTVTLLPVRVQGEEAAPEIARALQAVSALKDTFGWDVVLLGRGGGSLEDLWPFNEEMTARAIAACTVPVISAVGHEIDVTISDMVADWRAPTPTAAAQWVVSRLEEVERRLMDQAKRLHAAWTARVDRLRTGLAHLEIRLTDPRRRLVDWRLAVDDRLDRLVRAMTHRLHLWRMRSNHATQRLQQVHPQKRLADLCTRLDLLSRRLVAEHFRAMDRWRLQLQGVAARLESLSPLGILARGYSLTFKLPEKILVRRASQVHFGDMVRIQLAEGQVKAQVVEISEKPLVGQDGSKSL
ncbi:exodeoxyribonuclease VII large subunit [Desulfosoma caldarium]|uniref:Exodeoxyribonuclease 7 large subunit n=1 Tax=Desulfosoma caldarium TaxID=610254 RepID=A0A3N1UN33_9BACT|nr:exodeoxyribonuclease VII large subunit [Desulfosoma caldarium]ROQ90799.1 exodeoxyribonuclease VII large subunit [Desulfosoma caldarium]